MRLFNKVSKKSRNKKYKLFLKTMRPNDESKILDVGAGPGTFLEAMYKHKKNITSLDINKNLLRELKNKYPDIKIVQGSALKLPFKNKSFDIVFSNAVIEHVGDWKNQKKFAKEIQRVGKKWFITTPNKYFFLEPHYRVPFYQFVPKSIQRGISKVTRVGPNYPKGVWQDIYLLSSKDMKKLFPTSIIYKQRITLYPETIIAYGGDK